MNLWAVFPTGRMAPAKARVFADFVAAALHRSPPAHSFKPTAQSGHPRDPAANCNDRVDEPTDEVDAAFATPARAVNPPHDHE
jgi:hypothetical protein